MGAERLNKIFSVNDVLNAFSTALVKLFNNSLDIAWISLDSFSVDNKLLDSLSLANMFYKRHLFKICLVDHR